MPLSVSRSLLRSLTHPTTSIRSSGFTRVQSYQGNFYQIRTFLATEMQPSRANMSPKELRPSASLIVINAENEILMVQRHSDSRSFAGAHVFPGGNFDKTQDSSCEMTAIRETFEETGILLASRVSGLKGVILSEGAYEEARKAIHSGKLLFSEFLSKNDLVLDAASLLPFSTWVTPPQAPRRFRTRFFLTFLSFASAQSGPSSGAQIHRLPTPDSPDNDSSASTEVVSAKFIHPRDVLAAYARGEIGLMPPQFYLLSTLRDIFGSGSDSRTSTFTQRERIRKLSQSPFGRMEFNPRFSPSKARDSQEGVSSQILVLEGDETRGGKKGHLHRITFVPQKRTLLPRESELVHTLDIFTDLEVASAQISKL